MKDKLIVSSDEAHDLVIGALEIFLSFPCPVCNGDCGTELDPVIACPVRMGQIALQIARASKKNLDYTAAALPEQRSTKGA